MATLKPTLTLVSSDATSDALSITLTKTLTTGEPNINMARAAVTTGAATELIGTSTAVRCFVYIKNMDASNAVNVRMVDDSVFCELDGGEFMFYPCKASTGVEVIALSATTIIEYGFWNVI